VIPLSVQRQRRLPTLRSQRGSICAAYPGAWASNQPGATDPYYADVVNLSHFDGANGATTYVDNGPLATNLGQFGTGALSTSQAKFGTASLSSGGGGAGNSGNTIYKIGTSDFTVEMWLYPTSFPYNMNTCYWDDTAGNNGLTVLGTTGYLRFWLGGSNTDYTTALTLNAWNFVAYSRTGSAGKLYLGGTLQGSGLTDSVNHTSDSIYVGMYSGDINNFQGYVDDFRFTIGVGRYSASCPVPTAPFPNT